MIETTICNGVIPMHVRTGPKERNDRDTVDEVHVRDVYRLKSLVESGFKPKRIMDIGAHIGTFTALAAHYWPESWVWSFEPIPEEFSVLALNAPKNSTLIRAAVLGFYGLPHDPQLYKSNADEQRWHIDHKGNCISAMEAFDLASQESRYAPDFLKLDCEQSEVNILRQLNRADLLKYVPIIHGEWHFQEAKAEVKRILSKTHHVEVIEESEWNHFYADRR